MNKWVTKTYLWSKQSACTALKLSGQYCNFGCYYSFFSSSHHYFSAKRMLARVLQFCIGSVVTKPLGFHLPKIRGPPTHICGGQNWNTKY
jgi:hypothetical protein